MTKKKWTIKQLSLLIAIVILATATVAGSLAYIFTKTEPVKNTFEPVEVTCQIVEPGWTDGNTTKSNVKVKNTGGTDAYIRVAIVATWQDDKGQVAAQPVTESDYEINFINTDKWKKSGDYWYYKVPIASGDTTAVLIESCTPIAKLDGYTLHVEIIADAIQANPAEAVVQAWGANPANL